MSSTAKQKSENIQSRSVGRRGEETYHGVRIPEPRGSSRFSTKQLKRAVDAAIDKHRFAMTDRK